MSDLPIPEAARAAFAAQHNLPAPSDGFRGAVDWSAVDADIRAIAAPVVAADLRRIADSLAAKAFEVVVEDHTDTEHVRTLQSVVTGLRARADEWWTGGVS